MNSVNNDSHLMQALATKPFTDTTSIATLRTFFANSYGSKSKNTDISRYVTSGNLVEQHFTFDVFRRLYMTIMVGNHVNILLNINCKRLWPANVFIH